MATLPGDPYADEDDGPPDHDHPLGRPRNGQPESPGVTRFLSSWQPAPATSPPADPLPPTKIERMREDVKARRRARVT